ncbi:hypothetical protein FEV09_16695, partial [Pseudanabaena catenata USMAC16]
SGAGFKSSFFFWCHLLGRVNLFLFYPSFLLSIYTQCLIEMLPTTSYCTKPSSNRKNSNKSCICVQKTTLLVHNFCGIDDKFAIGLINQVVRLCQVKTTEVFHILDNDFRSVIQELVKEKPILLWNALSNFFEIGTPSEIFYLEELVGHLQYTDGKSQNNAGIIFGVPETEYINWAKKDPKKRLRFLCNFYPILEKKDSGESQWHPALVKLTNEFGEIEEFCDALESRLQLYRAETAKLETYLTLFKSWRKHPKMSHWVKDMINSVERQIDKEKKRTGGNP